MTTRTLDSGPARTSPAGPLHLAARLMRRLHEALARADALYIQRRHLAELDERMLRDIGVTRADVDAELRRTVPWRALF